MDGYYSFEFMELGLQADRFRHSSSVAWQGPCPFCGGVDRFVLFTDRPYPSWNWECRKCGRRGWADQLNPRLREPMTPEQRARLQAEQQHREEERLAERRAALARFTASELWEELHERLGEEQRAWWTRRGVPPNWQDFWNLGYTPAHPYIPSPAYTIPIYDEWSVTRTPVQLQYRLTNPPEGVGKYVFTRGLPARPFLGRPDIPLEGQDLVILEGGIKAMVICIRADWQTIGLPGYQAWCELDARLRGHKGRKVVWFDPGEDAQRRARELARLIGGSVLSTQFKPDDGVLRVNMGYSELNRMLRHASPPH